MRTSILGLTGLLLASAAATPAMADEIADSGISVSGNAAVVSDYRFRGVSLSDGNFAIQGGIDLAHESGFYLGTWGSSLASFDDTAPFDDGTGVIQSYDIGNYGALELDIYAGWSGEVASGITADVGVIYYLYPDALNRSANQLFVAGVPQFGAGGAPVFAGNYSKFDTDYWETYASVGFTFGPAEATVGAAYAWDQDSLGGDDNLYLYTDVAVGIPSTPITVTGHVGYTDGFLTFTNDGDAFDFSIGADWAITDMLSIGVMWTGVEDDGNLGGGSNGDDNIVGTLSVSF